MRDRSGWQPAQPGVMVFVPAPGVSVDGTQQSFSRLSVTESESPDARSQGSRISDTVILSCEDELKIHIKYEPTEASLSTTSKDNSPGTLVGDDDEVLFDAISTAISTPKSSASSCFLEQLVAAAQSASSRVTISCPESLSDRNVPTPAEDFVEIGYSSERTDFQEDTPSPSLRKSKQTSKQTTQAISRHFRRNAKSHKKPLPIRRLSFGSTIKGRPAKNVKRSANAQSLENLRSLERAPSHSWDQDERELLCILNRWYCGSGRTAELEVFAKIFNSITALDIAPKRIRVQYHSHIRLYGGDAYPEYARVFSVPFDDPEGRYAKIRALIEAEAVALDLDLHKRQSDLNLPSGRAKFAKSPKTRDFYKSLVRRASEEARWKASQAAVTEDVTVGMRSIGTTAMAVRMPLVDECEIFTDVETSPKASLNSMQMHSFVSAKPHLVFRVWDGENRTMFVEGSFVAQAFLNWPRPFPPPIALEDPSNAGKILTLLHLSREGDTPVYISTASSLLQALTYASNMKQAQIALIDLNAPSLQGDHKVHHAADVFTWLKAQGLARWARYRGNGEYFCWSDITSDAILHMFHLTELIQYLNNDSDCRNLLSFDVFEPGTKTTTIAAVLREKNVILNTATARALGKIARAFGMNQSNVTLRHVRDFVARLVDGWSITNASTADVHTLSSFAAAFATALGTHGGGYTLQDIMGAFMEGVDHGTKCIAHWSRSRSGSRRQRFRTG